MKTMVFCASVGLLFAVSAVVRCASANLAYTAEEGALPWGDDGVCHIVAEAAYEAAVASGDPLPDGAYNRAEALCDWDSAFGPGVSLNDLISADGASRQ